MSLRGYPFGSSSAATTVPGCRPDDLQRFETYFLDAGVAKGVGSELAVVQHAAGANMSVDVGAGATLISVLTTLLTPNYTFKTWLVSDAVEVVAIASADPTNPRIDRIVAKFNPTVDPNGAASNIVSIERVAGTPAGSPSAPATPSNAISLATVAVAAGATSILTANITDTRVFVQVPATTFSDLARATRVTALENGSYSYVVATGSANAYAAASPALTAYAAGNTVVFKANHDCTGATTLNVNGLGAKAIKIADGATDTAANDIKNGQVVKVVYDGTNFQMVSPSSTANLSLDYFKRLQQSSTPSAEVGASTTNETDIPTYQYTVPANYFTATTGLHVNIGGNITYSGTGTVRIRMYLGSTVIADDIVTPSGNTEYSASMNFVGTAAAGASVDVNVLGFAGLNGLAKSRNLYGTKFATNGTLLIKCTVQFSSSQSGNHANASFFTVDKISTVAF